MIFKMLCDFCTGLDIKKIEKCMGDPNADSENPVLKEEQDAQVFVSYLFILVCLVDKNNFCRLGKEPEVM
jgi:hypothetical protein